MQFLIMSKNRSTQGVAMWWLPNGAGYTNDIDAAGKYSAEESARIVLDQIVRDRHEIDIRVPVSAIGRLVTTRRVVDLGDANNHAELMAFKQA